MKIKIKVKELTKGCMPTISSNGDWVDLRSAVDITIPAPQSSVLKRVRDGENQISYRNVEIPVHYIPLGIAMKLPEGFEAIVASRSSTPKNFSVFTPIGIGIIDNEYCGNKDQWCFVASSMKGVTIKQLDRVCQFRIQLSQKATIWQKIKWLLSSGIELVQVDKLESKNRKGFGSTGIK
jgi:dUTP pyrophosphatase